MKKPFAESPIWKRLTHCKTFTELPRTNNRKPLPINLNQIHVASTLGIGVFILTGYVTREVAGPSIIISLVLASFIGLLTGFYYAELGNRIQKNGSAYTYAYVCIGEWAAFVTGWHLLFEYIIGIATVCKVMGYHLDSLLEDIIRHELTKQFPMHWSIMADYFDFLGFGLPIIFGLILLFELKRSKIVNKVLLLITISVMLFTIIAGAFKGNSGNFKPFYPFGVSGVFTGAATVTFAFNGLDFVYRAKNRTSTFFGFVWFLIAVLFLIASGIIIAILFPYYELNKFAPFPHAFNEVGWITAHWIISIGGILALLASLFGLAIPLQRTLNLMTRDGLILHIFGNCTGKTTVPIFGTIISMLLSSLLAGLFTLPQLINMLSIGTLFAFLMVSISILLLRYADHSKTTVSTISTINVTENRTNTNEIKYQDVISFHKIILLCSCKTGEKPLAISYYITRNILVIFCFICLAFSLVVKFALMHIENGELWPICLCAALLGLALICIILMSLQPMQRHGLLITVPLVPLLPCMTIFLDIFLMVWLTPYAWIRFLLWNIIGCFMYIICIKKYRNIRKTEETINKNHPLTAGIINIGFIGEPEMKERVHSVGENSITCIYQDPKPKYLEVKKESRRKLSQLSNQSHLFDQKTEEKARMCLDITDIKSYKEDNFPQRKVETSSSSSSLDDIILCSEIKNTLTEKKEPNGKTYFIDQGESGKFEHFDGNQSKLTDDSDQNSIIAYLDDVLDKEEVHVVKSLEPDLIIKSSSVVAVVHLSSNNDNSDIKQGTLEDYYEIPLPEDKSSVSSEGADSFEYFPKSKCSDNENKITKPNLEAKGIDDHSNQQQLNEIKRDSLNVDTIDLSLETKEGNEISNTENSIDNPLSFKDRLSLLLGQQRAATEVTYHKPKSAAYQQISHTKSEPNIMNLIAYEKDLPIDFIPPAPKFDPEIYRTLGSRSGHSKKTPGRPVLSTAVSLDATPTNNSDKSISLNEEIVDNHTEHNQQSRIERIKNELENIFKKGPPTDRYSNNLFVSTSPVSNTKSHGRLEIPEASTQDRKHVTSFRDAKKPFDTVTKQKILFEDVLKSINSRPSLLRATSPSKNSGADIF